MAAGAAACFVCVSQGPRYHPRVYTLSFLGQPGLPIHTKVTLLHSLGTLPSIEQPFTPGCWVCVRAMSLGEPGGHLLAESVLGSGEGLQAWLPYPLLPPFLPILALTLSPCMQHCLQPPSTSQ